MTSLIIITHGEFGAYLLEAAEMIAGAQPDGMEFISVSPRAPVEEARRRLCAALERGLAQGGVIIFTDMLGGSPANIAFPPAQQSASAAVITGVNLNMVLSAISYRNRLEFDDLVRKVVEDGKKSVCDLKALFNAAKNK
ncbi:MAG: PTS sugar transporter subunit IIA [Elusimicrobiales bacterium]